MPKATLTFNLPEERSEFKLANKACDLSLIIWDFSQELRNKTKYGDGKPVSWEDVHELWRQTLKEYEYDPYSGE